MFGEGTERKARVSMLSGWTSLGAFLRWRGDRIDGKKADEGRSDRAELEASGDLLEFADAL